jgi:hypothetical protein
MRSFVLLFIVFSVTSAAYAQVPTGAGTALPVPPMPLPPIFSGFSNSVIDHTGNLLMFDNAYPVLVATSLSPAKTMSRSSPPTEKHKTATIMMDPCRSSALATTLCTLL